MKGSLRKRPKNKSKRKRMITIGSKKRAFRIGKNLYVSVFYWFLLCVSLSRLFLSSGKSILLHRFLRIWESISEDHERSYLYAFSFVYQFKIFQALSKRTGEFSTILFKDETRRWRRRQLVTEKRTFTVGDGESRRTLSVEAMLSPWGSKRWLLLSKQGLSKQGVSGRKLLLPWKFGLEEGNVTEEVDNIRVEESVEKRRGRRKVGTVDHELVLKAMSNGFEATEQASFEMTEKALETNPELALMGSCLLVAQMRDDDVYVMNIGDSRALVAQYQVQEMGSSQHTKLVALQLTTDHSTIFLKDVSGRLQALSKHTGDEFNFESLVDEY